MSRILRELLGESEPRFTLLINRLESAAGQPSIDVRLTADLLAANRKKIAELQLDEHDTNGPELYHSLLSLVGKHDQILQQTLTKNGSENLLHAIKKVLLDLSVPQRCWAIKTPALRRMLALSPPKTVMKQLGYRSVESMIKREQPGELLAAAFILESPTWRSRYITKIKSIKSSEFENREISVAVLDTAKWGAVMQTYVEMRRSNLICLKEVGLIAVLPMPDRPLRGMVFTIMPLLIRAMHDIRNFSVYAKLHQVRVDFGNLLADYLITGGMAYAHAGRPVPWSVLQRHLSKFPQDRHRSLFGPHVVSDDLHHHTYTDIVVSLNSAFDFWDGSEYLGAAYDDGVVSYNLLDASLNYCNNVPYHKRFVLHMREALQNELTQRYIRQQVIEEALLTQLEQTLADNSRVRQNNGKK